MAHTVNNLHVFKSEILPKWMTKIFYPQFSMFVYELHDCKLWNTPWWQEPAFDKVSDRRVRHSSIEPQEILNIDGQMCAGLKPY